MLARVVLMWVKRVDDDVAEDALVRISHHVPLDVPIGRPMLAHYEQDSDDPDPAVVILTDDGTLWFAYRDRADRLTWFGELCELTTFRAGREYFRAMTPVGYDHR